MKIRKFNESSSEDIYKELEYICESLKDFTYVFSSRCTLDKDLDIVNPTNGIDFSIEVKFKLIEQLEDLFVNINLQELFDNSNDFNNSINFLKIKLDDLNVKYRIRMGDDYSLIINIKVNK